MPFISVIAPVYYDEKTVQKTLESVLNKTIWKVGLRVAIAFILPPQAAKQLLTKMSRLTNLDSLLLRTQLEPF